MEGEEENGDDCKYGASVTLDSDQLLYNTGLTNNHMDYTVT